MPGNCVVPGCGRRGGFSFPSDPEQSFKWMIAIKRDAVKIGAHLAAWEPSPHSQVCEKHFTADDFRESVVDACSKDPKKKRFLKVGAVPSVFPWSPSNPEPSTGFLHATQKVKVCVAILEYFAPIAPLLQIMSSERYKFTFVTFSHFLSSEV